MLPTALQNVQGASYSETDMGIRIFIIEEHKPAREMLAKRLASLPDMAVVGTACDGEDALPRITELHPDLVLMDTKMKRGNGLEVCWRICSANGGATVIVLTSYVDPQERRAALGAGASGYLLKEAGTPTLVDRIRRLTSAKGPCSSCK